MSESDSTTSEEGQGTSVWRRDLAIPISIAFLSVILITTIQFVVYHQYFNRPMILGSVDIREIVQIKQALITGRAMRPGATDKDRADAFDELNQFASSIEGEIDQVAADCRCTVFVRAAIVKGSDIDLTPKLKEKLGMGGLTLEAVTGRRPGK